MIRNKVNIAVLSLALLVSVKASGMNFFRNSLLFSDSRIAHMALGSAATLSWWGKMVTGKHRQELEKLIEEHKQLKTTSDGLLNELGTISVLHAANEDAIAGEQGIIVQIGRLRKEMQRAQEDLAEAMSKKDVLKASLSQLTVDEVAHQDEINRMQESIYTQEEKIACMKHKVEEYLKQAEEKYQQLHLVLDHLVLDVTKYELQVGEHKQKIQAILDALFEDAKKLKELAMQESDDLLQALQNGLAERVYASLDQKVRAELAARECKNQEAYAGFEMLLKQHLDKIKTTEKHMNQKLDDIDQKIAKASSNMAYLKKMSSTKRLAE